MCCRDFIKNDERNDEGVVMIVGIAAGGTGGHIIPALHVAKALIENGHQCIWFGRKDSLESRLAATHNIQFVEIHTEPMKRTISSLMTLLWRMFISIKSIRKQNLT